MADHGAATWDAEVNTLRGVLATRLKGFDELPDEMQRGLASAALVIAVQDDGIVDGLIDYLRFDLETRRAKGL